MNDIIKKIRFQLSVAWVVFSHARTMPIGYKYYLGFWTNDKALIHATLDFQKSLEESKTTTNTTVTKIYTIWMLSSLRSR